MEDVLQFWKEHDGFNAVRLIEDPKLVNQTSDENTVTGVYYFSINGNYGFMCNRWDKLTQHAANLLCESLGHSKAKTGNGIGWFTQGQFFYRLSFF